MSSTYRLRDLHPLNPRLRKGEPRDPSFKVDHTRVLVDDTQALVDHRRVRWTVHGYTGAGASDTKQHSHSVAHQHWWTIDGYWWTIDEYGGPYTSTRVHGDTIQRFQRRAPLQSVPSPSCDWLGSTRALCSRVALNVVVKPKVYAIHHPCGCDPWSTFVDDMCVGASITLCPSGPQLAHLFLLQPKLGKFLCLDAFALAVLHSAHPEVLHFLLEAFELLLCYQSLVLRTLCFWLATATPLTLSPIAKWSTSFNGSPMASSPSQGENQGPVLEA
eukprot:1191116-Prorocentrum_minimum.AAC.5